MLSYLVQSACIDADGNITRHLPFDPDCGNSRPMGEDDLLLWRKHDWGGSDGPIAGWQASDAVLAHRGGAAFIDQTFDFGAPAADNAGRSDAFYRFDANDGGDAILIIGDTASAFLTQDGGTPGLQWFLGPGCSQPGSGRYVSWVLFKSDAGPDWRSVVAELRKEPKDTCPSEFSHAFTRYKRVSEAFPFQRADFDGNLVRQVVTVPSIISEHYDKPTIAASDAMERFYYGRHLGKVRWEAWSTDDANASRADALRQSGRCAELADSTPPDEGWKMIDCRMWTNIVSDPAQPGWHVRDFDWPPANLSLQQ